MDWTTGIQRAIDYIEAHIDEPLDPEEIARQAYSSSYHFQRVFGILCGWTLGEYIRNRRLALAGEALQTGGARVIDVALKYGRPDGKVNPSGVYPVNQQHDFRSYMIVSRQGDHLRARAYQASVEPNGYGYEGRVFDCFNIGEQ